MTWIFIACYLQEHGKNSKQTVLWNNNVALMSCRASGWASPRLCTHQNTRRNPSVPLNPVFLKAASSPSVSCSSSVVFWVTHLWSFWRAVGTTARLSTLPMQTSEQPNSPSIWRTWATGGTPESWQDRDASQNQRQLGLDGVTPPAAHCPCRLLPGQNQGGTRLVFFFFLNFCFIPKEKVLSYISDCPPFFGCPKFPHLPVAAFVLCLLHLANLEEDRRTFLFLGIWKLVGHLCLTFPPSLTKCLH